MGFDPLPAMIILYPLAAAGIVCGIIGIRLALRNRWWGSLILVVIAVLFLALPVYCQLQGMQIGRARASRATSESIDIAEIEEEIP